MTIKNFIGYLSSTQSLVLGNKCFKSVVNLIINKHQLLEKHKIYCLEKLNSRELYNMQLIRKIEKPTAQTYFKRNFQNPNNEYKTLHIHL